MTDYSISDLIAAELESGELDLPLFNRTALRLQELKESEDVTIDEITQLILQDQALATRLLNVANSAFFGGLKQIDTISGAVIRLGTQRVADMALLASQASAHASSNPLVRERIPDLWARAFVSAVGCQWLAEQCALGADPETAFLAGLLHDVGELYLYKVIEKLIDDGRMPDSLTPALIDDVIEAMHARVGSDVMRKAGLPAKYADVALAHEQEEFDASNVLLALCRLLDQTCIKLGIGCEARDDYVLAATQEAQVLGLSEIKLAQLEVRLEDALSEAGETVKAAA